MIDLQENTFQIGDAQQINIDVHETFNFVSKSNFGGDVTEDTTEITRIERKHFDAIGLVRKQIVNDFFDVFASLERGDQFFVPGIHLDRRPRKHVVKTLADEIFFDVLMKHLQKSLIRFREYEI